MSVVLQQGPSPVLILGDGLCIVLGGQSSTALSASLLARSFFCCKLACHD